MDLNKIRHSLAHILAHAIQDLYPGTKFGIGPVIENGFYYDLDLPKSLIPEDLLKIEKRMRELIKQNIIFKKNLISKDSAKKIFKNQPYKLELLKEFYSGHRAPDKVSVYVSGEFTDFCKGNHINSTKEIPLDAFKLTKVAGAYWRGSEKNPMLTRIYGIAFSSKKELSEYLNLEAEAEKRDHRKLGEKLDLFSFQEIAPGAAFWHPKGMIIVKELEKWWRKKHEDSGYLETSTPIMVKKSLFEKSGHWEHYRKNIFTLEIEGETYALKPMNCPESTYIYSSRIRSYKDLPLKFSEIGRLFRNELSGTISGLFRVHQLTMDDAHIYLRENQIQSETKNLLKLVKDFYRMFGFKPEFKLATRPEDFMGSISLWKKAEKSLSLALKQSKIKYELKSKDGAFYGPKIDIYTKDSLKRSWQLATIQLDFQLPERFNLHYIDEKGKKRRPVIIHRAIFGSFERFIGVLLEHLAGSLPFWLAPEQIWIIPIAKRHQQYAKKIHLELKNHNLRIKIKSDQETVSKKIREGEIQKIPYLLVVGDEEIKNNGVRIRSKNKDLGLMNLGNFLEELKKIDKNIKE
ncbi:MAG: threonine--tRNA ligase [Patescibacteria group bacterium]